MSKSAACLEWMRSNLEVSQSSTIEALARLIESDLGFTVSRLYLRKLRIDAGIVAIRTRGESTGPAIAGQPKPNLPAQLVLMRDDIADCKHRADIILDRMNDASKRQEDIVDHVLDIKSGYKGAVDNMGELYEIIAEIRKEHRSMVVALGELSQIVCGLRDEIIDMKASKPVKKASKSVAE